MNTIEHKDMQQAAAAANAKTEQLRQEVAALIAQVAAKDQEISRLVAQLQRRPGPQQPLPQGLAALD